MTAEISVISSPTGNEHEHGGDHARDQSIGQHGFLHRDWPPRAGTYRCAPSPRVILSHDFGVTTAESSLRTTAHGDQPATVVGGFCLPLLKCYLPLKDIEELHTNLGRFRSANVSVGSVWRGGVRGVLRNLFLGPVRHDARMRSSSNGMM